MAKLAITFEQWKERVNQYVIGMSGCDVDDLPDWDFRTAYDNGMGCERAAKAILRAAREY